MLGAYCKLYNVVYLKKLYVGRMCKLDNVVYVWVHICKCVEGAGLESEWPVEQGGAMSKKGKKTLRENIVETAAPFYKKAAQNEGKTSKVL